MGIDENPKEVVAPDIEDVSDNIDIDGVDVAAMGKLDNDKETVENNEDEESDKKTYHTGRDQAHLSTRCKESSGRSA